MKHETAPLNSTKAPHLFSPLQLGVLTLPNRVVMSPMTRNRAQPDGVPGALASTYYGQRASAGLIITEATQISPMGKGYFNTPGIHSPEQADGWRTIVDRVHANGGAIFLQLWHVGRISHTSLLPDGVQPVAPSAIRANSQTFTTAGPAAVSEPRALTLVEIRETVKDYGTAAANARSAGFDGVELHAANGYLIDQFLRTGSNQRTDDYGGSAENRVRFLTEVLEAITTAWDPKSIGVRFSPLSTFNDMRDSDPEQTFSTAIRRLDTYGLGYLHVVERVRDTQPNDAADTALIRRLREMWSGVYIANSAYDRVTGEEAVRNGHADAIAYGRLFLANPDLPYRFQHGLQLNAPDPGSFYGGTEKGYTDYPVWEDIKAATQRGIARSEALLPPA
jgi:N-ethylmaleimide reductase